MTSLQSTNSLQKAVSLFSNPAISKAMNNLTLAMSLSCTLQLCNEASCTRKQFQIHLDPWGKEALSSNQQFITKTKLKSFSDCKVSQRFLYTVVFLTFQSFTVLAQSQWHLFHPVLGWFCQNTVNNFFALWQGTRRRNIFFVKKPSLTTECLPQTRTLRVS